MPQTLRGQSRKLNVMAHEDIIQIKLIKKK